MKKIFRTGIACCSFSMLLFTACTRDHDRDPEPNNLSASDKTFMKKAAYGNNAEISFGQLALERGSHQAVRKFGTHMITEHGAANTDLKVLGWKWKVDLPDDLDAMHKAKWMQLKNLSGHTFDTAYINSQIMDHDMAAALYQNQLQTGTEAQLNDYAAKYLPHILQHRLMIDSVKNIVQ